MVSRVMPRAAALLAALFVLTAPLVAEACPYCAGRSVAMPVARAFVLGAFVLFPYAVVYAVVRFIKNADPSRASLAPLTTKPEDHAARSAAPDGEP
ncbi:MAG TPA: hypothetical protein VGM56_30650 [Byssovorax sp.]